jgi:hypothetical protein
MTPLRLQNIWNHAKIGELNLDEDGQGNPAAGSHRRAGRGEHG